MNEISKGEIVIYKAPDGSTKLDVKLEEETVWLTLSQLSFLLQKDKSVISRHINNIFNENELNRKATVAKFATVQIEGNRSILRDLEYFNLDVIISVGYRVKSKRGTQFRIWANKILKDYIVKGYSLNEKRLKEQTEKIQELEKTLEIFSNVVNSYQLKQDEFSGILKVISDYALGLKVLDDYDHQKLEVKVVSRKKSYKINYQKAIKVIEKMKEQFNSSQLFGREKDESFKGTVSTIFQTFNGKELYPSIEEKAAHLLYFTIKNHSFVDGNKRIAAALFLWFLNMNNYLYLLNGRKRIADNALVAMCLLIAESKPKEKDMIVKVLINLINKNNN